MMLARFLLVMAVGLSPLPPLLAHEGHDHGTDALPLPAAQTLGPRMEAASANFELLAALDNGRLVVWLDRFASNEPVLEATVEVESPALSGALARQTDGSFALAAGNLAKPGSHALVFSIGGAAGDDLLNGTLVVPAADAAGSPAVLGDGARGWLPALGVAVLAILGVFIWRSRRRPA